VLHKKDKNVVRGTYMCVGIYGYVECRGKGEKKQITLRNKHVCINTFKNNVSSGNELITASLKCD
jgi:hypothetical protein